MGNVPFFISERENDIYAWVMSLSLFLKNKIYESLPIDHLVTWKSIENHTIESFVIVNICIAIGNPLSRGLGSH
jgi:hypothetical protein